MIIKNEIPILEFDTDREAVINPRHENLNLRLPERAVYAFLGENVERFAKAKGAEEVFRFVSASNNYPIYVLSYKGKDVCLVQAPVGAAPAAQIMDWLIGYGAKKIISAGSCGSLNDIAENTFLIPYRALRDEGSSYHYAPPSRFIDLNRQALSAIEKTLTERGLKYREVICWSTDGFFRETKEKVRYRKEEGCEAVEMECSALAACAQLREVLWGEILFTGDSLADTEKYDERNFGIDSRELALKLCFETVLNL